jgi:hypothetical protein
VKSFDDIMKKRQELMDECRLECAATIGHLLDGVYGMLWGVGHEDAPDLPQPKESWELCKRADIIMHRWPTVSRLYDYRKHKELYKKCYGFVKDLHKVAQGEITLDDLNW